MHPIFSQRGETPTVPVTFVTAATWPELRARLDARERTYAEAAGFEPRPGQHLLLPGAKGELVSVLFALDEAPSDPFRAGALPGVLPAGTYRFANPTNGAALAALAFALGAYRFARYRKTDDKPVRLELPAGVEGDDLSRMGEGGWLARALINPPANDRGPAELEYAAGAPPPRHDAKVRAVVGDDLLKENFP